MVKAELGESAKRFKLLCCQSESKLIAYFDKIGAEEAEKLTVESDNARHYLAEERRWSIQGSFGGGSGESRCSIVTFFR